MKISGLGCFVGCEFILMLGALALATPPTGGYHLLKKIPLGAAPGGGEHFGHIAVDSPARHVYLTHGTDVNVIDADSGAVVGTISGMKRNHAIALVKELGKGGLKDATQLPAAKRPSYTAFERFRGGHVPSVIDY
jgi:hypothetical protein